MLKNTIFTLILAFSAAFANAQTLNDFNDVRQMGVLLNPAHIGKADAKGELGVHLQNNSNNYYSRLFASLSYVHHLKLKNGDGLNIGLIAENQGFRQYINIMGGGLNVAYIHNFNEKNALSGGITASIVNGKQEIRVINIEETDNVAYYSGKYTFLYPTINLGFAWKNKISENANLSAGFAANNINRPTVMYNFEDNNGEKTTINTSTYTNYTATFNADFMVSKVIGFAPMLMYSIKPFSRNIHTTSNTFTFGSDIRFRFKGKHAICAGYFGKLNPGISSATYNLGYENSKMNVGLSYGWLYSQYYYYAYPILQTNFRYAF